MMERKKVDTQILMEKGDFVVVSLANFNQTDFGGFAALFRQMSPIRKDALYLPMFDGERETCAPNVWTALSTLVQRGAFPTVEADNYTDLLTSLGRGGHTVYMISKSRELCEKIFRENTARVRIIFCDLDPDGQIYWGKGVFLKNDRNDRNDRNAGNAGNAGNDRNDAPRAPFVPRTPIRRDYTIATTPTIAGIHPLTSSITVAEGSVLYDSSRNAYRLESRELRNNGAYTYSTDREGVWAKIYDDGYNSSFFEDKVRRMLKNPVDVEGIVWPRDVLMDASGIFRGFLMDSFGGEPLQTAVLKRDGQAKHFPDWTKVDICTLTLTILQKIKELHKRGILLGCINPAAIRIVDQNTVFFCDTDDFQIEGYPTLSRNVSFAAPENLDKKLYLATLDSENFSVAELVFMLMMTGKTPYVSGKSDPISTIKRMRFPFFINDYDERNPSLRIMPSTWRYMWSHLGFKMKRTFCNTFQKNMLHNAPGKRVSAFEWYGIVEQYREEILASLSPDDRALYPATFRKKEGDTFYACAKCGVEHPKFFFDPDYFEEYHVCNACIDLPSKISYTCVDCGRTFIYKIRTALFHRRMRAANDNWKDQRHCPECKAKKEPCCRCKRVVPYYEMSNGMCRDCQSNTVYMQPTCRGCGRTFPITYAEKRYFDSKGFSYPKKCESCRKEKWEPC